MANNIKGNAPNAIVAKATVSFVDAGINGTNTEIVYLVDDPLKSFVPGRAINGISGFVAGKGYYMVAKVDMDLEAFVVPPIDGTTPPVDDWTDFDYTSVTNITESPANVWIASGGSGGYGHLGLASLKLASGVDGAIITQFVDNTAVNAVFGFNDSNAQTGYSGMKVAFWNGAVGGSASNIIALIGGGTGGQAITAGDWFGIFRTGTTLKLRKSTDKVNWTDMTTFSYSSGGILYPVVDLYLDGGGDNAHLFYPQHQGLS